LKLPDRKNFSSSGKYLLGAASEIGLPLFRAAIDALVGGRVNSPGTWRKGLILGHTHIGDVLYRTCSLAQLKSALPGCEWDYLTAPESAPLLEGNPAISNVLPWQPAEDTTGLSRDVIERLTAASYDVVLCTNTVRHYHDFLTALRLGIPNRVGFADKGFSAALTHPVEAKIPQPYPAYFREMVASIARCPASWPLQPRIILTEGEREQARDTLRARGLLNAKPLLACTLTTRQPRGQWPIALFVKTLEAAYSHRAFQLVFCGSASDKKSLDEARSACRIPSQVIAGQFTIRQLAAFLESCSTLLAMDSGPRHLANAVATPVAFLRNLSYSGTESGAYCHTETDLAPPDECLAPEGIAAVYARLRPDDLARRFLECHWRTRPF
jgi:ADP-heptose:LPS heptosyltransferase